MWFVSLVNEPFILSYNFTFDQKDAFTHFFVKKKNKINTYNLYFGSHILDQQPNKIKLQPVKCKYKIKYKNKKKKQKQLAWVDVQKFTKTS